MIVNAAGLMTTVAPPHLAIIIIKCANLCAHGVAGAASALNDRRSGGKRNEFILRDARETEGPSRPTRWT